MLYLSDNNQADVIYVLTLLQEFLVTDSILILLTNIVTMNK